MVLLIYAITLNIQGQLLRSGLSPHVYYLPFTKYFILVPSVYEFVETKI